MIELTVKTLDSQNHAFTVEDDITVAQFKVKIADTVNIPAETQRIIYCGRVLQDDSKLKDYDVHGKVVHLVQRAPPAPNQSGTPRSASPQPQPQRRGFRVLDHGNAMYLGSMAFPSNLMESQGIVPPPPTHSLAASRLNVARRMLKRAEAVIKFLEDPQSRPAEQPTPPEEPQEEVTPVFEARVIVPSMNEPLDEALVLSAVENSLLNVGAVPVANSSQSQPEIAPEEGNSASASVPMSEEAADEGLNENRGEASSSSSNANLQENASRTAEMADLLTMLGQLQLRFAPFLERYQTFMQEDQTVPEEEFRPTQTMLNRVSEVMHFLGHAYHSLSDIIVKARTQPPRALLCRPILIQHSAVVQTGFPIQLEAQINFSAERPNATASSTTSTTTTSTDTPTTTSSSNTTTGPTISAQIQPSVLGFPFFPAGMHVQPFPIAIRGISRTAPPPTTATNNNATAPASATAQPREQADGSAPTAATAATTTTTSTTASAAGASAADGAFNLPGFNNPNVELFMEVTPEHITIDSVETTVVRSNSTGDPTRQTINANEQDLVQSILQFMNRVVTSAAPAPAPTTTDPSAPPAESATTNTTTSATNQTASGQNSQARGNTQTNPTTSTHTRSTSRPHVHLAQHAMQGFDPFLPCNSHHVTSRRRIHIQNVGQNGAGTAERQSRQAQRERGENTPNAAAQNFHRNLVYTISEAVMDAFNSAQLTRMPGSDGGNRASANAANQSGSSRLPPQMPAGLMPHIQNMNLADAGRYGPLSQFFPHDAQYEEGQSVFTDFIMLISRHFTVGDTVQLNAGRLEPLMRIRSELREFVLRRVLDGASSTAAVDRGVNRIISEMTVLNELGSMPIRDDIDIVRSVQMLLRSRLPNIINLSISRSPNALRMLVDQCRITLRQLCALVIRANTRGQDGILEVFEQLVTRYMAGIPREVQQWAVVTTRGELVRFLNDLSVPESILQPYIVKKTEAVLPPVTKTSQNNTSGGNRDEPMELDSPATSTSSSENASINLSEVEGDPLPPVVIGSESWHNQVPADWVPIIARDSQRQRRQNPQQPFSDAYLSGMPSKRRKIVTSAKPQGSLPQVITESVRRAVTATGLSSVAPLETVAETAGQDLTVQSAYRDLLRTTVQAAVQNNEEFTPDRFPNASNYFNKQ